MSNITGL